MKAICYAGNDRINLTPKKLNHENKQFGDSNSYFER